MVASALAVQSDDVCDGDDEEEGGGDDDDGSTWTDAVEWFASGLP